MPRQSFLEALRDVSGALTVRDSGNGLVALADLIPAPSGRHLFDYLRASGQIVALEQAH